MNTKSTRDNKHDSVLALQEALRREVALLTSLNHPNLVRFCGVCLDPPLLIMEYYRHGNVYSLLQKARRQWRNLSAKTRHIRQATKVQG
jgi:serine/threonine protein kinase